LNATSRTSLPVVPWKVRSTLRWATRAAASLLIVALACTGGREPTAGPTPDETESPREAARSPEVTVLASGEHAGALKRSIAGLKAVGLWDRLTADIDKLRLGANLREVPQDRHLASSQVVTTTGPGFRVRACRIEFYPSAISEDLSRQEEYHASGGGPPPPARVDFMVALLAHELAHCLPGQPGERIAGQWERRALERVER
jgi:hypothetical protein